MITAVIAQTKQEAQQLAHDLGIETPFIFGTRCNPATFEGLRVERVFIHADTDIPEKLMSTIYGTALKTRPRGAPILRVWVRSVH